MRVRKLMRNQYWRKVHADPPIGPNDVRWIAQFHVPWVSEAGGGLIQSRFTKHSLVMLDWPGPRLVQGEVFRFSTQDWLVSAQIYVLIRYTLARKVSVRKTLEAIGVVL